MDGVYSPVRDESFLGASKGYYIFNYLKLLFRKSERLIAKYRFGKVVFEKFKSRKAFVPIIITVLLLVLLAVFSIFKSHASISTYFAQWTNQADFENNASTVNTATIKTNVDTSGTSGSVTLSTASSSITQTDDGNTNNGFNLAGYSHDQTALTGTGGNASVQLAVSGTGGNFQISSGSSHTCVLKGDGTVYCWGYNGIGQLGDNTTSQRLTPVQVVGVGGTGNLTGVSMIAAGGTGAASYSCALKSDGTVFCWGYNGYGQLGNNSTANGYAPVQVLGVGGTGNLNNITAITTNNGYLGSEGHACALKADGTVFCWGNNAKGQLGDGTTTQRLTPVQVVGVGGTGNLIGVSAIAAGESFTCAIKSDGTVYCWGDNVYGELGINSSDSNNHTAPAQVVGVGGTGNLTGVSAISANNGSVCTLKSDGSMYCWGYNDSGQLGDGTTARKNSPVQVKGVGGTGNLTSISSISAGGYSSCAVKSDGTAYCWGSNNNGQLGDNTTTQRLTPVRVVGVGGTGNLTGVSLISSGGGQSSNGGSTCAAKSDGTMYCWGYNYNGQLGDNTTAQRNAPVQVLSIYGSDYLTGVGSIVTSTTNDRSTCALKSDGTVWCWGDNSSGQGGVGDTSGRNVPVEVLNADGSNFLTGVTSIAMGGGSSGGNAHVCALKSDGSVFCWGLNDNGQLGINNTTNKSLPVQVCDPTATYNDGTCKNASGTPVFLSGVTAISAGVMNTCAVKSDGSAYCWGQNTFGQLGINSITGKSLPTQVCDIGTTDTSGTCGGAGHYLTGVTSIATGYHTCAVKSDGTTYCWGYNNRGQLGVGDATNRSVPVQVLGVGGSGNLTGVNSIKVAAENTGSLDGYTCAVKSDNTAYCWGPNGYGQLGINTSANKNYPVQVCDPTATYNDGTCKNASGTPVFLTNVGSISAGSFGNACAVKLDGTAYCWGNNVYGQLGDGTNTQKKIPVQVHGVNNSGYLSGVTAISPSYFKTCASNSDGIYCWGTNDNNAYLFCNNIVSSSYYPIYKVSIPTNFNISVTTYYSSGTFTSGIMDLTTSNGFGALSWTLSGSGGPGATFKVRTSANADMSGAPDWSTCTNISNGGSISDGGCVTVGHRYLQYQASLTTSNNIYTTSLDSVTINYSGAYASSGTITKLLMDAGAQATFTNMTWNGENTSNTSIKFRTRGITDAQCTSYGSCSAAWAALSPTLLWSSCDGTSGLNSGLCSGGYYTSSGAYITANNDSTTYPTYRYLEVELTLTTSNGGETPRLDDFMIGYKKNTPPTIANDITPVQGSDGLVHLTYDVSDADTAEGINQPGYADVSFQYWDGAAWQAASSFLKPDKTTPAGAADGVGHVAVSASSHTFDLYWNAKADAPNLFLNNAAKIKVVAYDGEALNNTASSTSATFLLDTKNPVPGTTPIKIDATTDPATLTLAATDDSVLQMKVGLTPDLSDVSSWSSYSSNTALTLPADPLTVYVQFKDAYNNTSAVKQLATIETPANVVIRDVSNVNTNTYALFLAWKSFGGIDFKQYDIYRASTTNDTCPDSGGYSSLTTITDKNTNFYLDPNLSNTNTYCYKVVTMDTYGNASFYSAVVYKKPNGQGGTDNTPPSISGVQVISTTTQTATIQWDTDELSNSNIDYSTSTNFSNAPDIGVSSMKGGGVGLHKVILTGLHPGTTYYFQVKSTDPYGNTATDNNNGNYYTLSTNPGAAISHVTTSQVNNNNATIVWDTDIPADSSVVYSPNSDLSLPTDFLGSIGPVTHHSVTIANLTQGSRYYYYVKSTDGEGNVAIDDNAGNYYYFTTDNDLVPPAISQIAASAITDTSALIVWATDERSSSEVEFGTAPVTYTDSSSQADLNISHAVGLTGLSKNTVYYYRIVSTDANGNTATSSEHSFTTLEKQVSHSDLTDPGDPTLTQKSDTEAVITLPTTNTDSISHLCYGPDPITDMDNCANSADITTPTRIHSYHLTGLNPDTLYYARVKTMDSENPGLSFTSEGNFSFTTLAKQVDHADLVDPGDPAVTQKSDTEAVVTLPTANTDSTSKICYDTSEISDMKNCAHYLTISDPTRIHSYHLTGLDPSTTYFIKTEVTDSENESLSFTSNSVSFTTAKSAAFDHDPLSNITDIADPPKLVTDKNAVITFNTDQSALCLAEATTSQGSYTAPIIYQEDGYEQKKYYNLAHSINFTSLIFSTSYYYKITCEDNLKTVVSSGEHGFTTSDQLFTTQEFGNMADKTPPTISNIKTSAITGESVTITWDTDEISNSFVRYGLDNNYGNMAGDDTINSNPAAYATTHSVVINNLIPATAYLFKAVSYDASGNVGEGAEQSFTTAAPSSISSIQVVSASLNQATITWNTGVKTTSSIEYGLKDTYGQLKEDTAMTQAHSISLSGLQSGVTYHYRVKGKDNNNNLYASADNTFIPKSPPQVSGIKIDNVTEHGATIRFSTDVPTDALVNFTDPNSKDNSGSQGKSDLMTSHELNLTNLAPGATFAISIKVRDQDGNETIQTGPNLTTGKDVTPPKIDKVLTDSALTQNDTVQTIISWNTDEPATTYLRYRESLTGDEKETKISDSYTTNHVAVSTLFKPGAVYYFKVKSVDESGNEAVSQDFSLLTPRQKENIIQIILSNFQDIFSWLKFN